MEGSLEFHRVGVLIGKRMGNRNPVEGLMLKMFLIGSPAIRSFFRAFVERRKFTKCFPRTTTKVIPFITFACPVATLFFDRFAVVGGGRRENKTRSAEIEVATQLEGLMAGEGKSNLKWGSHKVFFNERGGGKDEISRRRFASISGKKDEIVILIGRLELEKEVEGKERKGLELIR